MAIISTIVRMLELYRVLYRAFLPDTERWKEIKKLVEIEID